MKNKILTVIMVFAASVLFAGNSHENKTSSDNTTNEKINTKLVSGRVIDKVSGEALPGVEVRVNDKTIYTDLNGNFMAMLNLNDKTEATVKYISYSDTKITINPSSCTEIEVQLESK